MGERLRIGFVGAGLIAWAHALVIKAMAAAGVVCAEVGSVYEVDPARGETFAQFTGASLAPNLEALASSVDAVYVCTPTAAHRDGVQAAVAAGCALFCEKPLATDLAGAEGLAGVVSGAGVPAQVGLVLRTHPVFSALGDLVAGGSLGAPMAVVFRDDQFFPTQGHYASSWRSEVANAGGGALIEHSIHDLDILRVIFGEVRSVAGSSSNHAGFEGVEDTAVATLVHGSGAISSLVSVWHQVTSRRSTRRVEVFCEDGYVWLDDDATGPLHVETSARAWELPCPHADWVSSLPLPEGGIGLAIAAYAAEDRAFIEAVGEGRAPAPGFEDAVHAHRLVDAFYRSAAAGGVPLVPVASTAGRSG